MKENHPINRFLQDSTIYYEGFGDWESVGTNCSVLEKYLKAEPKPDIVFAGTTKMVPFIAGEDGTMHPLFEEDAKLKNLYCLGYDVSPKRLPRSFFKDCCLDILVVDQDLQEYVCHLFYRKEELQPNEWEVLDDFYLPRCNIYPFLQLLHRIRNASLSELLS